MFISNPSILSNVFSCRERLANKLINVYKIPLLSKQGNKYYFIKTDLLEKILNDMNFFEKWFYK